MRLGFTNPFERREPPFADYRAPFIDLDEGSSVSGSAVISDAPSDPESEADGDS